MTRNKWRTGRSMLLYFFHLNYGLSMATMSARTDDHVHRSSQHTHTRTHTVGTFALKFDRTSQRAQTRSARYRETTNKNRCAPTGNPGTGRRRRHRSQSSRRGLHVCLPITFCVTQHGVRACRNYVCTRQNAPRDLLPGEVTHTHTHPVAGACRRGAYAARQRGRFVANMFVSLHENGDMGWERPFNVVVTRNRVTYSVSGVGVFRFLLARTTTAERAVRTFQDGRDSSAG